MQKVIVITKYMTRTTTANRIIGNQYQSFTKNIRSHELCSFGFDLFSPILYRNR